MTRRIFRLACILLASIALSGPAAAQLFRAYVSSSGSDTHNCTLPSPCRLLPAALAAVADGGEIWMLDSANFNTSTVAIGKSVSILAVPGAVGSLVATGGPAISITTPSISVSLRNVVIIPLNATATDGIDLLAASSLTLEKSLIANMPQAAIGVLGGAAKITDTTIRDNANGVIVQDVGSADLFNVKLLGNVVSVGASGAVAGTATISVSDSIFAGGTFGALAQTADPAAIAQIFLVRCTLRGVGTALESSASGGAPLIVVGQSMIVSNSAAWNQSGTGSVIQSLGNNIFTANGASTGTLTPLAAQ